MLATPSPLAILKDILDCYSLKKQKRPATNACRENQQKNKSVISKPQIFQPPYLICKKL